MSRFDRLRAATLLLMLVMFPVVLADCLIQVPDAGEVSIPLPSGP